MAFDHQGNLLIVGVSAAQIPTLFRTHRGTIEPIVTLPDAIFLNGMTHLTDDRYLVADSYKGAIWDMNIPAKTAQIWCNMSNQLDQIPTIPSPLSMV